MEFSKERVALSAIRPSETNPRADFGDLAALADAIRATGGEPVNPPIVVRDGNVYRIVDGERRYRALKKVWAAEPDREVGVLVALDMDAANELVAMVATDDKLQLSDVERARGVQQMLLLGVDEERAMRASRATAGQVRAAKRLSGSVPEGWQGTLAQLEAASRLESEEDREAVLSAGEDWVYRDQAIRSRIAAEKRLEQKLAWLQDAGIPIQMGGDVPEGMMAAGRVYDHQPLAQLKAAAEGLDRSCLALADCRLVQLFAPAGHPVLEGVEEDSDPLAEKIAREKAAALELARRMTAFVTAGLAVGCDEVDAKVRDDRLNLTISWSFERDEAQGMEEAVEAWAGGMPCSDYERGAWLIRMAMSIAGGYRSAWSDPDHALEKSRMLLEVVEDFSLVGFDDLGDEGEWLVGQARGFRDSMEAGE